MLCYVLWNAVVRRCHWRKISSVLWELHLFASGGKALNDKMASENIFSLVRSTYAMPSSSPLLILSFVSRYYVGPSAWVILAMECPYSTCSSRKRVLRRKQRRWATPSGLVGWYIRLVCSHETLRFSAFAGESSPGKHSASPCSEIMSTSSLSSWIHI